MLNKVMLIGKPDCQPAFIKCKNGREMALLTLKTSEVWKKKTGEIVNTEEIHYISVFHQSYVDMLKVMQIHGTRLYIEGKICKNKYTNKDGQLVTETRIIVDNYNHKVCILESSYAMTPDEMMFPGFDYAPSSESISKEITLDEIFQVDNVNEKLTAKNKEEVNSIIKQIREKRSEQLNVADSGINWEEYGIKEKGEDE